MNVVLFACLLFAAVVVPSQNAPTTPQKAVDPHAAGVDTRGDRAMGFSHDATAHHFTLLRDGGVIEVEAKTDSDRTSRDEIRGHLAHIIAMFRAGNFEMPMFIHDRTPPGVPVLKEKRNSIRYTYERTHRGGRVRIETHDPDALKAVHEFLKFQIEDHRTGDPVKPS